MKGTVTVIKYEDIKFAVIGGDMRMLVCAQQLASDGYETAFFGFDSMGDDGRAVRCRTFADALNGASAVILPVPYSTDGCRLNCPFCRLETRVEDVLKALTVGQVVLAGVCTSALTSRAEELKVTLIDYMKDEELAVRNAVPTAEGAAEIAMRELPVTLHGCETIILGYGKCGKACADIFSALHARVTVCARRNEQLAYAEASGARTAHMNNLSGAVRKAGLIVNTVPECILTAPVLNGVGKNTLIIDIASPPGGVDFDYAAAKGIRVHRALSLPGKVAPVTAGKNIKAAIIGLLERRGIL